MIRPVSDLRNNFADISRTVHETGEPVFLTKNGYGDMVVLSNTKAGKLLVYTHEEFKKWKESLFEKRGGYDPNEPSHVNLELAINSLSMPGTIDAAGRITLSKEQREKVGIDKDVTLIGNSNHIEGNTLTYGQTEILLLFGKVIGEADVRDVQEMTASNVGLRMMAEEAAVKGMPLTQNFIRTLHKTILREDYTVYRDLPGGLQTSCVIHAGQYKTRPNSVITRYGDRFEYASPEETPGLMGDLVDWYNAAEQEGKLSPVELAALFHYRYIRIHPFEDGNGRIARLMVNYILTRHDYPMIVVRSRKKREYLEALHQTDLETGPVPADGAHADIRDIRPFLKYFNELAAMEIYNDVLFVSERNENVWWYDGERIAFRTPNYTKILNAMRTQPTLTLSDMQEETGISLTAIQKLLARLISKKYVERGERDGSWRVFVTQ